MAMEKNINIKERSAKGLDISKYDKRYYPAVRPVDFVIQRATYGLKQDELFHQLWSDIQPVPIRAAYHYYNTGAPWKSQAENFLRTVAGKGYHFFALDYETFFNNLNAQSADDARRIMQFWRAETGLKVLLYCNPNVYENFLRPFGNWMVDWPLWISQWYSKWWYHNRAAGPKLPKGVTHWAFWQYGGDYQHPTGLWSIPGYSEGPQWGVDTKHVDLDMFNGTPEELHEWAAVEGRENPDPVEPPDLVKQGKMEELEGMEEYVTARKANLA